MKPSPVNIREERARSDIRVHPVVATAAVGFLGWVVLTALALGLGVLVTHAVVGHSLGHGDLDVARWFDERRTDPIICAKETSCRSFHVTPSCSPPDR